MKSVIQQEIVSKMRYWETKVGMNFFNDMFILLDSFELCTRILKMVCLKVTRKDSVEREGI